MIPIYLFIHFKFIMEMNIIRKEYGISQKGFLPDMCSTIIPAKFSYLTDIVNTFKGTDDSVYPNMEHFRELVDSNFVDNIPSVDNLDISEINFLYSILSMIVHRYIWCKGPDNAVDEIPKHIGQPWIQVSQCLGIPPVLTHGAVDLYNWSLIDSSKPFDLDNLKSNYLITLNKSEEWFYLIMVAIEGCSGHALKSMYYLSKLDDDTNFSTQEIEYHLNIINDALEKINVIISRMYERCDPEFFFNKLRIFLAGSDNEKYFPNGLRVKDYNHAPIKFKGGSAAQSSLIQVFDIFFNVKHVGHAKEFLTEMRSYMPGKHRDFLLYLESKNGFNIELDNDNLIRLKNSCIDKLVSFRQKHIEIVHRYIFKFIKKPETVVGTENTKNIHGEKGTGGTNPLEFLGQVIKDTKNKANETKTENYEKIKLWYWRGLSVGAIAVVAFIIFKRYAH